MPVVVNEAGEVAEVGFKSLIQRAVADLCPEMPLAEQRGAVAGGFQHFGQGDFLGRHVEILAVRAMPVSLRPIPHAAALRMAAREQRRPRRAAHGMRVSLGEADAGGGQLVHVRRLEVRRAVAVRIERSLVVGEEDDHVGPGRWRLGGLSDGRRAEAGPERGWRLSLILRMDWLGPVFSRGKLEQKVTVRSSFIGGSDCWVSQVRQCWVVGLSRGRMCCGLRVGSGRAMPATRARVRAGRVEVCLLRGSVRRLKSWPSLWSSS